MLFSVLIPVYNAEQFLSRCLESVLNQTEQDYEIILADDCSTDRSGRICEEFAAQAPGKIKVIHNETNQGSLLTRRTLFRNAHGDWMIYVDADDRMKAGALTVLKDTIRQYDCDLILSDMECIQFDGSKTVVTLDLKAGYLYDINTKNEVLKQKFNGFALNHLCSKAIRRQLIDGDADYAPWKGLSIGEDAFQVYPILDKAERIVYIHQVLYTYIKNDSSATSRHNKNMYGMRRMIWKREDFYLNKWNLGHDVEQKVHAVRINEIVSFVRDSYLSSDGKAGFFELAQTVRRDGILQDELEKANKRSLRKRYLFYCRCILNRKYGLLYHLLTLEKIALSVFRR